MPIASRSSHFLIERIFNRPELFRINSAMEIRNQCFGNFCTNEIQNWGKCKISEALIILEGFIRIRESGQDTNSIYQQISEHGDTIHKVYSIAGLEDPLKK